MLPFSVFADTPSEAELAALDLAALDLLVALIGGSIFLAFSSGLALLIKSIRQFGSPGVIRSFFTWFQASMSFFAIFMPVSIIVVFGSPLSRSWPGISIMLGLLGIEMIGVLRLIVLWEQRGQQLA